MNHSIIGFCTAAGKNNFRRLASEQSCQPFARQIDRFSRFGGKRIAAGRIAVKLCQERQHFLYHGRIERCGCVVIEVNNFVVGHAILLLMLLLLLVLLLSLQQAFQHEQEQEQEQE